MTLSLSEEKLTRLTQQCQKVYSQLKSSRLSLLNLIDPFSPTAQAILSGKIQFPFLQHEQITSLKGQGNYQGYVILGNLAR